MVEKNLHVVYRISDKGNPKLKLANASKWDCLLNAVQEFGAENFHVIADNCTDATLAALKSTGLNMEITSNGNVGTCRHIFNEVINRYAPEDFLYLLEDDYLHLPGSRQALLEGLEIADYVTLYDHPDMYHPPGMTPNLFSRGDRPKSTIYLTAHRHWRTIPSTTMTFAAKVKTLIEDRPFWLRCCEGRKIPFEQIAWVPITKQEDLDDVKFFAENHWDIMVMLMFENFLAPERRKKNLISALPGMATHTETAYLAPLIDWSKV